MVTRGPDLIALVPLHKDEEKQELQQHDRLLRAEEKDREHQLKKLILCNVNKVGETSAILTKKKGETQATKIRDERRDNTVNIKEIKGIIREYYEQ